MSRPTRLHLVSESYQPPEPPRPALFPPTPPPTPGGGPAKVRLLPAMRSLGEAVDDPLAIETVLSWLEVKQIKGPLSRHDLRDEWRSLATIAERMGRPACLIYAGKSGRPLVRLPRWLAQHRRPDPDPGALAASEALPMPAAARVIRAAARDPHTLARLRWKQMTHPGPH